MIGKKEKKEGKRKGKEKEKEERRKVYMGQRKPQQPRTQCH
jgi:hypothetical protein